MKLEQELLMRWDTGKLTRVWDSVSNQLGRDIMQKYNWMGKVSYGQRLQNLHKLIFIDVSEKYSLCSLCM